MVIHKGTLGVLQWYWDGKSYTSFDGVKRRKMLPVTLESHGLSGEDWWQVPNGTPLARKIALCYPFFDPVVVGGQLVDARVWPDWKKYGEEEPETAAPSKPRKRGKYNRRSA